MPLNARSDYPALPPGWRRDLALRPGWNWLGDPHFALALVAGMLFWLGLTVLGKAGPLHGWTTLLLLVLLQPLLEELLFRGLLQGRLLARAWGKRQFAYPINKKPSGYYMVAEIVAPAGSLDELERTLRLADDVVRHKLIRLPEAEAERRGMAVSAA